MNILKSLVSIWLTIAIDLNASQRTTSTFERRAASAGIPFLTVDLPSLGKDVDRSLSSCRLEITGRFKKKHKTELPVFMYELFIKVYHRDGFLRDDVLPSDIQALRQLLLVYYKFKIPFTSEQEAKGFDKFKATDMSVKTSCYHYTLPLVRKYFSTLFPDDPMDIRAHHSSGATADQVSNPEKRVKRRFIPSLHSTFGLKYFFNSEYHGKTWLALNALETAEPTSLLAFVSKDSRGPRTICMEPHERMFIQKGLQTKLYEFTETMSPAKGFINFTNQDINQRLARKASFDQSYATIDMKDASDLVPWNLVRELLRERPEWLAALEATRSDSVTYKDEVVTLNKFAPMGSALCFPIEAFVFWSIIRPITEEVWVYGDDIIVPNHLAGKVMSRLEQFGLVVNRDKSLYEGFFRESCGGEYYRGHDISIDRVKSLEPVSFIAFCNLITLRYGTKTSEKLIQFYEQSSDRKVFRSPPHLIANLRPLVFYTEHTAASDVFFQRRWNKDLQSYERRVPVIKELASSSTILQGHDALFDWLTQRHAGTSPRLEAILEEFEVTSDVALRERRWRLTRLLEPSGDVKLLDNPKVSGERNPLIKFKWLPERVIA